MNRLSPLIDRRVGPGLVAPLAPADSAELAAEPRWVGDVKLFAVGWVGGLIFFGTLLG